MNKIKVLCKANRTFQGDVEVKTTAFIDYMKTPYEGDLNKYHAAGRCPLNKKYPMGYAKLQKIAAERGLFAQFIEKGELQIACDAKFFVSTNKETGELVHWVRVNLGTKEAPYERNFYINSDVLDVMKSLKTKVTFIEYEAEADELDDLDFNSEESED